VIKVFDLHNDLPTLPLYGGVSARECEGIFRSYAPHRVVRAFWATELPDPAGFIEEYIGRDQLSGVPYPFSSLYAVEDLRFAPDGDVLERILKLPLLYAGLTWNYENALAGGAQSDAGLSGLGKTVVKQLAAHSVAIDTAHLNEKSFYDVLDFLEAIGPTGQSRERPPTPNPDSQPPTPNPRILNSHTCLKSLCGHPRNLSDAQIKRLLSQGGAIGVTAVAQFMGKPEKQGARADYLRQIDAFAQRFGINGLCIGTDFNGTDPLDGLSSYGDFEFLAQDLFKLGYSAGNVERIFSKNAEAFFEK